MRPVLATRGWFSSPFLGFSAVALVLVELCEDVVPCVVCHIFRWKASLFFAGLFVGIWCGGVDVAFRGIASERWDVISFAFFVSTTYGVRYGEVAPGSSRASVRGAGTSRSVVHLGNLSVSSWCEACAVVPIGAPRAAEFGVR